MEKTVDIKKFKRLMVNNKMVLIKIDLVIQDVIFLEKDEKNKVYNLYFPKDAENKVYVLGTSLPIEILDAIVAGKFNNNLSELDKSSGAKTALNGKSTEEEIKSIMED